MRQKRLVVRTTVLVELMTSQLVHDPTLRAVHLQQNLHDDGIACSFDRVQRLLPDAMRAALIELHSQLTTEREGER